MVVSKERAALKPLSKGTLAAVVIGLTMFTAVVVTVLWWAGTRGLTDDKLVTARFEALRIGLSIGIGGGGVFALYLAWRRQRSTEDDLDNRERALALQRQVAADTVAHQQRTADASEKDAAERRITELYTKAADQLGSDKAPVRLAGLYALERLAQGNPEQRQTIVNLLCAYLRMPFPPLGEADVAHQEREVRMATQRILFHHLRPDAESAFWPDIDLDLTGAILVEVDLVGCRVRSARFSRATFDGPAQFRDLRVSGSARFREAVFTADAGFELASFGGNTEFRQASFTGQAEFIGTTFGDFAGFDGVRFGRHCGFERVTFDSVASFEQARFEGTARFHLAEFSAACRFSRATFDGAVTFYGVNFARGTTFDEVAFAGDAEFQRAKFGGPAWFRKASFSALARFNPATFTGPFHLEDARFADGAHFGGATFGVTPILERTGFAKGVPAVLEEAHGTG
ncbi:pentapeptide repeat-containing protein [Actinokineospora alba]|uniref:pentapeptide repeat-containing protein n=1 Tax=Actinokineospora alba TaxID=504798 RepID=UPI001E50102E|nr:pentapeptide repeat-containing protein [Actinokineospora alba]